MERIQKAGDLLTGRTQQGQQVLRGCCDLEKEMLRGTDLTGHDGN